MSLLEGVLLSCFMGMVVAALLVWVWPVRDDQTRAIRRGTVLIVAAIGATAAMFLIGRELGTPDSYLTAASYVVWPVAGWWWAARSDRRSDASD
jgi:hypothetical protein